MEALKILLVEDNSGDAFLIEEMLIEIPDYNFEITVTETLKETVTKLNETEFDIVLLDLGLPDSQGLGALESVLDLQLNCPVIVITGLNDGKTGKKAMEMGAQSYMVKGEFSGHSIAQTILYSIERSKILKKLKDNEKELKKKNELLEESVSAKNMLISIISHDLRGPLTSIVGLLEITNAEFENLDDVMKKRYLKSILKSATTTKKLMENLLDWAHIQSNHRKVEPENIEVGWLIENGTNPLKQTALEKDIELEINASDKTEVFVDERMITTVIRNLVSNALKFTPRNGKVQISTAKSGNEKLIVSVADNGIGMPKEIQQEIFKIGKTTSSFGTENEPGSGFGLILVKEFVEKNNGDLEIFSEPGEGTKIDLLLPVKHQQ